MSMSLMAVAMASCETIPEKDRYIEIPKAEVKRKVLLEDFTGQVCKNCPLGHDVIKSLTNQYWSDVIPVAIHAGPLSWSETMTGAVGLAIPEGNELAKKAGVTSYPSGRIDRVGGVAQYENWSNLVKNEISKPSPILINLRGEMDLKNQTIKIVSGVASSDGGNYRLNVWITESGVVAPQILPSGEFNMEYIHSHVLRAVLTGVDGEEITISKQNIIDGKATYTEFTHNVSISDKWNYERISVVAFVEKDGEVLNADEIKLVRNIVY